ncbi:MAG: HDIG domain-containing protein [Bacteroidetes bacterium]|nr:HDIG domain-containing protein [Bacteroidota bacterium]
MNLRKLFIAVSNKHDLYYRIVLVTVSILVITSFLPQQVRFKYDYRLGQTWTYEELRAPFSYPVYKSSSEIDIEKEEIVRNAPVFYSVDTNIEFNAINDFYGKVGAASLDEKAIGIHLLQTIYQRGVFSSAKHILPKNEEHLRIIRKGAWKPSERSLHYSMQEALELCQNELERKGIESKEKLMAALENAIQPNLFFEEELTRQFIKDYLKSMSLVRGEVTEGNLIVRRGQVVDADVLEKLDSLRKAFRGEEALDSSLPWLYLGYLLLVMTAVTILLVFLWMLRRDILMDSRKITLLFLLIVATCAVYTLLLASNKISMLLVPLCILPLVTRAFFDTRTALFVHVLSMLMLGTIAPGGFDFVFMQIIAGMVSIFSIVNMRKRSQLFIAVTLIFASYFVSYIGLSLLNEGTILEINPMHIAWLMGNCLLTLLSYPLIFFIEKTFRVTSDFTLMELTDFNSELLRDLSTKAPGTFQHSLQVANLAESAIYKIGGNSLLVRVGALYHDIGKMDMPMYFIENQSTQMNPHDELSFDESASIIISHVIKGIEKARKFNLPDVIIDFIRTHHGNMLVQYFYINYVKSFPDQIPNEDDFRYPGPRPFSKETAVLMMADSVEAAAHSLTVHDQDSIDEIVEKIINKQIDSGQFENCDITFRDITNIKKIFKKMLTSIYHIRVAYPT